MYFFEWGIECPVAKVILERVSAKPSKLVSLIKYFSITKWIKYVNLEVSYIIFFHRWQNRYLSMAVDIFGIYGGSNNYFNNSAVCSSTLSGGTNMRLRISLTTYPNKKVQTEENKGSHRKGILEVWVNPLSASSRYPYSTYLRVVTSLMTLDYRT